MKLFFSNCFVAGSGCAHTKHHVQQFIPHGFILFLTVVVRNTNIMSGFSVIGRSWDSFVILL